MCVCGIETGEQPGGVDSLSPFTMWVLGIKLREAGMEVGVFAD